MIETTTMLAVLASFRAWGHRLLQFRRNHEIRPMKSWAWMLLPLLAAILGCGSSGTIPIPQIDPAEATARAMLEYDKNKDGYLDAGELKHCPGLNSMLEEFDTNHDGRLSATEIEEGLASLQKSKIGLQEIICTVYLDKKPLSGATVEVEPESFLGLQIKPARGTTNARGRAHFQIEGAPKPGCNVGVYRVRITKNDDKGKQLPARYNTHTELGLAVGSVVRGSYVFRLSSQ
jgi:hypothetical protein